MCRWPPCSSFTASRGVSLQIILRVLADKPWVHRGGTRSLVSYTACAAYLRTAFMLKTSRITLLMLRNTPGKAAGPEVLSEIQPVWHGLARFCLLASLPKFPCFQATWRISSGILGWSACVPKNSSFQTGRALHKRSFARFLRSTQSGVLPGLEIAHSQATAAEAISHGVSCLTSGMGHACYANNFRHLRRCTLCSTRAPGDGRDSVFGCQHFAHNRRQSQLGAW